MTGNHDKQPRTERDQELKHWSLKYFLTDQTRFAASSASCLPSEPYSCLTSVCLLLCTWPHCYYLLSVMTMGHLLGVGHTVPQKPQGNNCPPPFFRGRTGNWRSWATCPRSHSCGILQCKPKCVWPRSLCCSLDRGQWTLRSLLKDLGFSSQERRNHIWCIHFSC